MEPELFQPVERLDGPVLSRDLVGSPDNVAKLLLSRGLIKETEFLRPDAVKDNPAGRGLDFLVPGIAVGRDPAKIRIQVPDSLVNLDRALGQSELDLSQLMETAQPLFGLIRLPRFLGEIVAAQHDVLRRRGNRFTAGRREDVVWR